MKSRVILFILFLSSVIGLSLTMAPAAPVAAAPMTYTVTSGYCTGPGSITEAMALANANPGTDTITFTKDLQIAAASCPQEVAGPLEKIFILQATESVNFEGNGAKLVGIIDWVNTAGYMTLDRCPAPPTLITAETPGFIRVGLGNQDNSAISVTVRNLDMYELDSVARIEKNASLILEDLTMERIINHNISNGCSTSAIFAEDGANFTARRTKWNTIVNFFAIGAVPVVTAPAILSSAGGDLTIEDSDFYRVEKSGVIRWSGQPGSEINIVSSRFDWTGAIIAGGDSTTNIVNTIWAPELSLGSVDDDDRFANFSNGVMNIVASTLLLPDLSCDTACQDSGSWGWIYRAPGKGLINFKQSAVGVNAPLINQPAPDTGKLLDPGDGTGFSADEYSWMQPTAWQNAAALETATNQPNLLTGSPALRTLGFYNAKVWATPLDPGELIDIVPDAACGEANELVNPIDGTCITEDALGNPRVDANGMRNSGAVQLTLAPYLTVTGTGDQTVDLSWTKPKFSAPTTGITGYELRYRETGAASWATIAIAGPDTLTHQVTGLTNGTEYEFEVRAVYSPSGEGPWSNAATGTPYGLIEPPVVTAVPGDREVQLFWTEPSTGGHPGPLFYTVVYRPVGAASWIAGPSFLSGRITTIPGLTNGTEYEFGVFATATDGETGALGTTTATPFKSVQPPEPGTENCTLTAGYWSTHSEYGPSLYDSTWAKLANSADTLFFLSGQSYYQVINSAPKGNAYYNLAHQYIAAELNFLRGADPADVQSTFDSATQLFNTYTPAEVIGLKGPAKKEWTDLASILDDYNNGYTGPGYCTE